MSDERRDETEPPAVPADEGRGLTRRRFLQVGTAGALSSATSQVLPGLPPPPPERKEPKRTQGPGPVRVSFDLNGRKTKVRVEPRATLLNLLRDELGLCGTKRACDRGACGACTVLLDGGPANACTLLAVQATGRDVVTIEGLGTSAALSSVQRALVEHDAVQCGACLPGLVVACTALLRETPSPDAAQLRQALGGNLCRCGVHARVVEALTTDSGRPADEAARG